MNNKRLGKSVLSIVLAAAMAFSPTLHTYASEASADNPVPEETIVSESATQEATPAEEAAPAPEQTADESAVISDVQEYTEPAEEIPADMTSEPVEEAVPAEEEPAAPAEEETQPEIEPSAEEETVQPESEPAAEDGTENEDLSEEETEDPEAEEDGEEEAATRTEYTYEDDSIKVTAYLTNPEDLSDEAELYATPVIPATPGYNYNAYFEALNEGSDFVYDDTNTYLYDFAFWENGMEVQPAGEITVVAQFKNALLANYIHAESAADVKLIHLPLTGAAATAFANTQAATNITKYDVAKVPSAEINSVSTGMHRRLPSRPPAFPFGRLPIQQ